MSEQSQETAPAERPAGQAPAAPAFDFMRPIRAIWGLRDIGLALGVIAIIMALVLPLPNSALT